MSARVIYVDVAAGGANDGSSWANAYAQFEGALAASTDGDTLWVARGLYRPAAFSYHVRTGVVVLGGFTGTETSPGQRNPDPATNGCTLSGDAGIAIFSGDDVAPVVLLEGRLDGFSIIDGNRTGGYVGGVNLTLPAVLENVIVEGNLGLSGGVRGTGTIRAAVIRGNHATGGAGGVYLTQGSITDVLLQDNTSTESSAQLRVDYGPVTIERVTVSQQASGLSSYFGIAVVTVVNSTIPDLLTSGSRVTAVGSRFDRARIERRFNGASALIARNTTVSNSTVAVDDLYLTGSVVAGSSFSVSGTATGSISNSALFGPIALQGGIVNVVNGVQFGAVTWDAASLLRLYNTYVGGDLLPGNGVGVATECALAASLPPGIQDGGGNVVVAAPLFSASPSPGPDGQWGTPDDAYGDLHLQAGSPLIDQGKAVHLPLDRMDLDGDGITTEPLPLDAGGDTRVAGPEVDVGAYERGIPVAIEGGIPTPALALGPPAPNPARGAAAVSFSLARGGRARLSLYDALGRKVAVLVDVSLGPGHHAATLPTAALTPGVYVLRLETDDGSAVQTLTVAR